MNSMKYNRKFLRKLIQDLTDAEFDESLDDFIRVRQKFTRGMDKNDKINIVLDYFETHQEDFHQLLEAIRECNEIAYTNYCNQDGVIIVDNSPNISLEKIKEESSLNSNLIDELEKVLPDNELFLRHLRRVFQDFLLELDTESDLDDEAADFTDIFGQLEDFSEEQIVNDFIPRLAAYLTIKDRWRYRQTVSKLKKTDNFKNQAFKDLKKEYKKSSCNNYLIIRIEENQSYPGYFQIYGWFGTDEIIQNSNQDLTLLKNQDLKSEAQDEQTPEQCYTLEKLKVIFSGFINQIDRIIDKGKRLIIEFFLPSSLFEWHVEKWKLETSNGIHVVVLHEVRIRSLERLNFRNQKLYNTNWKSKWTRVKQSKKPLQQFFPSHCNCNVNTLVGNLNNDTIVGLKLKTPLKSGDNDKVIQDIIYALYYSGTPIALWFREEPSESDCEAQLDSLLQERLLQLPCRVLKKRGESQYNIFLLWDDPNRVIPNYQLQ